MTAGLLGLVSALALTAPGVNIDHHSRGYMHPELLVETSWVAQHASDPDVRLVRHSELRRFLPAAEAMFTEELGVSPTRHDSGAGYRAPVVAAVVLEAMALARWMSL